MMADAKDYGLDPIPFDDGADATAGASDKKPPQQEDWFAPPSGKEDGSGGAPKIQTFGTGSVIKGKEGPLHRPVNQMGLGASRVRTFHAKLNDGAMAFLDQQINDWLDGHPDYLVKFATTTVGVVEGKRVEPHLIINVWY